MFVLLSDSDVPLHPPWLTYAQLLFEQPHSRVDCCAQQLGTDPEHNEQRFSPAMAHPPVFTRQHWRKSFQWVALSRPHAVLVASDHVVIAIFARSDLAAVVHVYGLLSRLASTGTAPTPLTLALGAGVTAWQVRVTPLPTMTTIQWLHAHAQTSTMWQACS